MKLIKNIIYVVIFALISHSCSVYNNIEQSKLLSDRPVIKENNTNSCYNDNLKIKVSRTIDWDTFEFYCNSKKYKVRIIWIDTPETKHPTKWVQCFWLEASKYAKNSLEWKNVTIHLWKWSWNTDKYWRLLRYVSIGEEDFWESIISDWYAFSYKRFSHEKLDNYNSLEKIARNSNKWLWNKESCNY